MSSDESYILQIIIFHTQMDSSQLKRLGKCQYLRIFPHILLFRICQSFLKGCSCLKSPASVNSRFLGSYNIDCRGIFLCDMPSAHHAESMEGMERIGKTVLPDILFLCGKVLSIAVHVRQNIHIVMLKHLI